MADVSIGGGVDVNYFSHIIVRQRSGRLVAGGSRYSGVNHWIPWWTYSDDNGSTWTALNTDLNGSYFNNARPTWGFVITYDYTGVCMAVDGGDNIHCAWRDTALDVIWYTKLMGGATQWETPRVIGTCTADPNAPKVVVGSDNSVTVFYTAGVEGAQDTGWAVTSLDSGRTWQARVYVLILGLAGPFGACADNAGQIHLVYGRSDGTRQTLRYIVYTPSTQTFGAETEINAGYRSIEPDIAIGVDDTKLITWAGTYLAHTAHLNWMYAIWAGGIWEVHALLTDPTNDVRHTAVSFSYDPDSGSAGISYVYCCARIYIDATTQYEIRGTYAQSPYTSWSTIITYSNTTIANNKAYSGLVYQRYPHWVIPKYGIGLSYLVETNYAFRYTSWEGVIGSSTPAVWNVWHPIFATIKPKV